MLNEKCYGIVQDHSLIYTNTLKKDLQKSLKIAIKEGANSFILGAKGDFNKNALKLCRNLRKKHPHITIKIVLTDTSIIKAPDEKKSKQILEQYQNEQLIFVATKTLYLAEQEFTINEFIINNSFKCIGYINENNYKDFSYLSAYPFKIFNLYTNKETILQHNSTNNKELIATDNIILIKNDDIIDFKN